MLKILPNKIMRRNRNTQEWGFILQCFTFSTDFRGANKGSKIFIVLQAMADVRFLGEITLNDATDSSTFAGADILFDEPIIN